MWITDSLVIESTAEKSLKIKYDNNELEITRKKIEILSKKTKGTFHEVPILVLYLCNVLIYRYYCGAGGIRTLVQTSNK